MLGTCAAVVVVCGASLALGQVAVALCRARRWSWMSPAVGLALLVAICWATVRLPGGGAVAAAVVAVAVAASALHLHGRLEGGAAALRAGLPVAIAALAATLVPFAVEGHFGVLGTGFNPDMSQHLLAADRLSDGTGSRLLVEGYPMGPHAIVVALEKGLGIGLVAGFSGLTIAVAVLASLTALAAFSGQPPLRRTAASLLVGIPYLVASYFAQGAFKETMQALLVLAFVLSLRESTRAWADLPLRLVPAALVAIGSIYVYSFPALAWLLPTAALWLAAERTLGRPHSSAGPPAGAGEPEERARGSAAGPAGGGAEDSVARSAPPPPGPAPAAPRPVSRGGPATLRAAALALAVFLVGGLPELGRAIDFGGFETFEPAGPGLGNLFGQISPLEALGIWPSGDFRVAPGDGAAPAIVYYLGAALALALLAHGLRHCLRYREHAVLAGLASVAAVYLAARLGGTPYTSAKALQVAAPLLTLTILLPLLREGGSLAASPGGPGRGDRGERERSSAGVVGNGGAEDALARNAPPFPTTGPAAAALVYLLAAAACSLLALANAPVGPRSYSPALTSLRSAIGADPTFVLVPRRLLDEEHGVPYVAWELRGGRICIEPEGGRDTLPPGVRYTIAAGTASDPPFDGLKLRHRAGPYLLWERAGVAGGPSPCPLVAVRQARQGSP